MTGPAPTALRHDTNDTSGMQAATVSLVILAILGVVAALYLGRGLFIPIALALFLNALLRPFIRYLQKYRISAPVGAAIVVLGLLGVVVGTGILLAKPVQNWMVNAPDRLNDAQVRLRALYKPFQKVSAAAANLGSTTTAPPGTRATTTVTLAPTTAFVTRMFGTTANAILGGVTVLLLLYLLLAAGGTFLVRLMGIIPARANKRAAAHIAAEVESAVAQYLAVSTMLYIIEAVLVGLACWALGMPSPLLWAALTLMLEFIPYIGGAVLVVILTIGALASFDSVGHAVLVPISYLVISAVQNNLASPILYGNRLKLNPVAVMIAVLFWGFLWGAIGAILSVPIVAAIKILCDHIDALSSLGKFLEA
jgi:predicted PurR-regulated permease PerM